MIKIHRNVYMQSTDLIRFIKYYETLRNNKRNIANNKLLTKTGIKKHIPVSTPLRVLTGYLFNRCTVQLGSPSLF